MILTNTVLRERLSPIKLGDEHISRLWHTQGKLSEMEEERVQQISRQSYWKGVEVITLIHNGFTIFVGEKFLKKCRYAASYRLDSRLTLSSKDGKRWDKSIVYTGDVPDSVLDKLEKLEQLVSHKHYRTYTGSLGTDHSFRGLDYLVVSTSPLPVKSFALSDPFLLAFRREDDSRPIIEVSDRGRIKKIRQIVKPYDLLIVGMWDMDTELFV